MGLTSQEAYESVRFSFSELNTCEEIKPAVETVREVYVKLLGLLAGNPAVADSREAE